MRVPVIQGVIDRRVLVNYRIDPDVARRHVPGPFRPKLVGNHAIAGICLIRLREIRPKGLPARIGMRSENAAHRFAVEWDEGDRLREGVYIPRRDTDSRLNALVGGWLFPGVHNQGLFCSEESEDHLSIDIRSRDDVLTMHVEASRSHDWRADSIFSSLHDASDSFEQGSVGYSPARANGVFEGLELRTATWEVEPLSIDRIESSFFSDETSFPPGTAIFDNALLMTNIAHEWRALEAMRAAT